VGKVDAGETLGKKVGFADGLLVGLPDGFLETGDALGLALCGLFDGEREGEAEGFLVLGEAEGFAECGENEGDREG